MSAKGARATSTGAARQQDPEPVMSKSKKAPHLAAVEAAADSASAPRPPADEAPGTPIAGARALRDAAADRLRADARGGEVGPPGQLALGGRHRRGALLPGPAARSRPARAGPAATASCCRRATPPRSSTRRWPGTATSRSEDLMEPAQARRASPGPPGHDPHARDRGLDRIAGPGPLDEPRDRARAASGPHRRGTRVRAALRRRLPGGPDVGGGDRRGPLPCHEPDRDRRLQPSSDRRNHRGSDGHRGRAPASSRRSAGTRSRWTGTTWAPWSRRSSGAGAASAPAAIVCQTRKGCGVSLMEDQFGFHGKPPTAEQAEQALTELEQTLAADRTPSWSGRAEPHDRQGPGGDADGVRRCAGRAGRAPRRRGGPRCRPRGVHHEHQVRPQVPRALLQRRRRGGEHDVDGLWPGGDRQGAVRVHVRDLRHRPRVRPGAARHRPQRAAGAGVRLARRTVAGRGRRLAPDDRGHRADARDAPDAGDRAGRLQPGLPCRDREL